MTSSRLIISVCLKTSFAAAIVNKRPDKAVDFARESGNPTALRSDNKMDGGKVKRKQ